MVAWPASFHTTFTIKIVTGSGSLGADGMAFVLAQNSNPSPSLSFGSYMGIFDQSTEGEDFSSSLFQPSFVLFRLYWTKGLGKEKKIAIKLSNFYFSPLNP